MFSPAENPRFSSTKDHPANRPAGSAPRDRDDTDIVADARDVAKIATETLKHQASELGIEVGHELNKAASDQKERGAEALRTFAGGSQRPERAWV